MVNPQLAPSSGSARPTPTSPPRLVLNGTANNSRTSQHSLRASNGNIPSDFNAQPQDEMYPDRLSLTPSIMNAGNASTDSPVIPLSPDPFGRFSSSDSASPLPTNTTRRPDRVSSLAANSELGNGFTGDEPLPDNVSEVSKPPSSRFSADSIVEERETLPIKPKDRGTLMSVKSIRKLWRKANKSSTSSANPPNAEALATPRVPEHERDANRNASPVPPVPPLQLSQKPVKPARRDSGLDPFYFDQDSKYPVRRSPSPQSMTFARNNVPSTLPPLPTTGGTITAGSVSASTPVEKKRTSRKSILRWKSGPNASPPDAQAPLPGEELPEGRRRRPSMVGVAGGIIRASISSASEPSPSVPEIPSAYRASHYSRPSVTSPTVEEHQQQPVRQTSIRRKPVPSSATSTDSQASTDPLRTPISSSLSHGHGVLTSPPGSEEFTGGLDNDSRFEAVTPKTS